MLKVRVPLGAALVLNLLLSVLVWTPNKEKPSENHIESAFEPEGMNPIINATSRANMALITNALAAYTYISGMFVHSKEVPGETERKKHLGYQCL